MSGAVALERALGRRRRILTTAQSSLDTLGDSRSTDLDKRIAARELARSLSELSRRREDSAVTS
jgi:hypothetical protein